MAACSPETWPQVTLDKISPIAHCLTPGPGRAQISQQPMMPSSILSPRRCLTSWSQEPGSRVSAVEDAPQESKASTDVISIPPNIFLRDHGLQGEGAFHVSGFGET
jgi:hypothetical protein